MSFLQFSVLLVVIILFEIGIGAFGYVNKNELETALNKGFNKTLHNYGPNKEAWDMVQSEVMKLIKIKPHNICSIQKINLNFNFTIAEMLWSRRTG